MKYFIETYGCQMNFAESAALEQLLRERGWEAAEDIQHCNLLIVNTCSVRITAETRARSFFCDEKEAEFYDCLNGLYGTAAA